MVMGILDVRCRFRRQSDSACWRPVVAIGKLKRIQAFPEAGVESPEALLHGGCKCYQTAVNETGHCGLLGCQDHPTNKRCIGKNQQNRIVEQIKEVGRLH